jgi:hypothetical protein
MYISIKKYLLIFVSIFTFIFIVSFINADPPNEPIKALLIDSSDFIKIFIFNLVITIIMLISSIFGISLLFIYNFIFNMGRAAIISGINPIIYYFSSLSHGICEILIMFFIFVFTIEHFLAVIHCFKTNDYIRLKELYIIFLPKFFPKIILILFLAAFIEVFVSNKIINLIL